MRRLFILPFALIAACSAGPKPEWNPTPPPTTPPPPPVVAVADAGADVSVVDPDAGYAAKDAGPPDSGTMVEAKNDHCSDGMILVEGEYCTKVEQKCLKEWYDKSNKKRICEKFESKSTCIGTRVKKRYCIDKYSWPNMKGERPEVMNNFYQAQVKCAAVGKRLCTESEWTLACEGPEMKPFPYGYVRDARKCNGDRTWDHPNMKKVAKRDAKELARLWQGVPSGSQPDCVSDYGVADLPGNNDEVVGSEHKGHFDSVNTGGPWYRGVRNQCRPKIYTHDEGFYYYFLGFRCCAEPDGAKTDPRVPKQIQRKWKFKRVENLARFSIKQVQKKLELKKEGNCTCKPKDILCKTMCGTLLGPEAKDADMSK
jgi:formylglycine-generating enzyme